VKFFVTEEIILHILRENPDWETNMRKLRMALKSLCAQTN
jgi:hypothetical protein